MTMFAGLDVGFKRTAVCVVDGAGKSVWRRVVDTHPEAIAAALHRWRPELEKVGLESGPMSPWLARKLGGLGFLVVCMDARRAADAVKSRRVKSDKADAYALAKMLRTGFRDQQSFITSHLSMTWPTTPGRGTALITVDITPGLPAMASIIGLLLVPSPRMHLRM